MRTRSRLRILGLLLGFISLSGWTLLAGAPLAGVRVAHAATERPEFDYGRRPLCWRPCLRMPQLPLDPQAARFEGARASDSPNDAGGKRKSFSLGSDAPGSTSVEAAEAGPGAAAATSILGAPLASGGIAGGGLAPLVWYSGASGPASRAPPTTSLAEPDHPVGVPEPAPLLLLAAGLTALLIARRWRRARSTPRQKVRFRLREQGAARHRL
jgi:hypothetical protein